jgi:hypothetical protein
MKKNRWKKYRKNGVEAILIEDNDVDTQDEKIPGSSFNCIHSLSFFLSLLFRLSHKRLDDYVIYSPRIDLSEGEGDPHTPSPSPSSFFFEIFVYMFVISFR